MRLGRTRRRSAGTCPRQLLRDVLCGQRPVGVGCPQPIEMLGLNERREQFEPIDDTRTRPREVAVRIDGIDPPSSHGWNLRPPGMSGEEMCLIDRALEIKPAGVENQNLGRVCSDPLPRYPRRWRVRFSQAIHSARQCDEFRHPVARTVGGGVIHSMQKTRG